MRNKENTPPKLASKLFDWYCTAASVEDLRGDIDELFHLDCKKISSTKAQRMYWRRVISLIFSHAVKSRKRKAALSPFSSTQCQPAMLKNYFVIATRNLARHKFFTIINVLGLAIGMSISLLFIAMLSFIQKYDEFHINKDTIYRVISLTDDKKNNYEFASAPAELANKLTTYSGISKVVRVNSTLGGEAQYEDKEIPLHGYFVDPEFMEVFTFPLLKGNPRTALQKPNGLLITESAGIKMFGSVDPIGKIISFGDQGEYEVTGVLKDHPKNSHMMFEVMAPYQSLLNLQRDQDGSNEWENFRNSYIYLMLPRNGDTKGIEQYLASLSHEAYPSDGNFSASFELQSLREIAPGRELYNNIGPDWGYASLTAFIFLTLLILLPACFNYANISISRALKRMKEIGLRKVMGGQRQQIFFQFITETVIITLVALIISVGIFIVIKQEFLMMIVSGTRTLDLDPDFQTILYFILFALGVGIIAGIVPAIYFSKLNPIQALKSKPTSKGFTNITFKKVLVVSQFALSLGFIMGVVIVLNQYRYSMNFDFGFTKENILDVELQGIDPHLFRTEFEKLSDVEAISMSSYVPGTAAPSKQWIKDIQLSDSVNVAEMYIDHNFIRNLGLTLIIGQQYSENPNVNKDRVIVNEEFLKTFKIPDAASALNQTFIVGDKEEVTVVGVVKNFHYMNLSEKIESFMFRYDPLAFNIANIKVASGDIFNTLSKMESTWKTIGEEKKFSAKFFDDEIADTYDFYFSMIKICGFLGLLAISISCLGLLGMVVFTVENRIKEIGIRKVMGANELNVTLLLSKHFIKLMLIAGVIAVPLTWLFFENVFLRRQYYKIDIGFFEIGTSLALMLLLGLAAILPQTVRAARSNPVDTLRNE